MALTYTKPTYANGVDALSAATFQPIADTLNAIAKSATDRAALGLGTLDADTVSGYGIGVLDPVNLHNVDLDGYMKGGTYYADTDDWSGDHFPAAGNTFGILVVDPMVGTGNYCVQRFFDMVTTRWWTRRRAGSGWFGWYEIFTAQTDGNGGQPPSPKPNETGSSGSYVPGRKLQGSVATGNTLYYSGATNETGTWDIDIIVKLDADGSVVWADIGQDINSGSWFVVGAGRTVYYTTRRIA